MPKTCYSIFTSPYKNIPNYLNNIKLGDTTIQRTATSKYLGTILDHKLTWQANIHLIQDLVKVSNSFIIIKNYTKTGAKNKLYHAFTHSKIRYSIEVYGQSTDTQINKSTSSTKQVTQNTTAQRL